MLKLTITWQELPQFQEKHPDEYNMLREVYPDLKPIELDAFGKAKHVYGADFEAYVNHTDDIPYFLLPFVKLSAPPGLKVLKTRATNVEEINECLKASQVHLPGNEMLHIRRTKVLVNECTDVLDLELQEGWKIIAVLPQLGQRRPDYILGHYDHAARRDNRP